MNGFCSESGATGLEVGDGERTLPFASTPIDPLEPSDVIDFRCLASGVFARPPIGDVDVAGGGDRGNGGGVCPDCIVSVFLFLHNFIAKNK